jgi:hypothetical protein
MEDESEDENWRYDGQQKEIEYENNGRYDICRVQVTKARLPAGFEVTHADL